MHFKAFAAWSFLLSWVLTSPVALAADSDKAKGWQAPLPAVAENNETWLKLTPALIEHHMPYGALASARNMINFFADLPSKEMAYKTIIELVDLGISAPIRPLFIPGDIEPSATSDFGKNYFFYKALADVDKKMDHWAQDQFAKINRDNFPKYIFYQAIQAYAAGKSDDAIGLLKTALSLTTGPAAERLASKEARTLARIYYEKEQFEKSLEIYKTYLLQLNPVEPTDWLEAAWNLYRLKQFPESLGYLYNFESKAQGSAPVLERFILRALIYREYCLVRNIGELSKSFEAQFGKVLDGIKLGAPLTPNPAVIKIDLAETNDYRQSLHSLEELAFEQKQIPSLAKELRPLAGYIYSSEIKMLEKRRDSLESEALQALAKHLVILDESLKYLRFDVIREKYNPDSVFSEDKPPDTVLVDNSDEVSFRLHWRQWGDYWRDERGLYRGILKNRCEN